MMNRLLLGSMWVFLLIIVAACSNDKETATVMLENTAADVLIMNAKVYTVNEAVPWAEAVAVSADKIVYVGDAEGGVAYLGENTEVVDAKGKMVIPGFVSGHDHLIASIWTRAGENLSSTTNHAGAWQSEVTLPKSQKFLYDLAARNGLTSVIVSGLITPNLAVQDTAFKDLRTALEMLTYLDAKGELKLRTCAYILFRQPGDDIPSLIEGTLKLREKYNSDTVRVAGIKIDPEGDWMSKTSAQLEPFLSGGLGKAGIPAARVEEVILAANAAGLDVITRVDGSATVRTTIDALEKSINSGNTQARNTLQHYHLVDPADHERVVKLELALNITPVLTTDWANTGKLAIRMLGKDRAYAELSNYSDGMRRGLNVSLSADFPSSPLDMMGPLFNIEAAITFENPFDKNSKKFPPNKTPLTLEQAIRAVTIYPAWQARMEDKVGTLEVGKYGDLVILDKNLFDVDPKDVADVKVLATMMGGRFTFRDGI